MNIKRFVVTYKDNVGDTHQMVAIDDSLYSVLGEIDRRWRVKTAPGDYVDNPFAGRIIVSYNAYTMELSFPHVENNDEIDPLGTEGYAFQPWQTL